MALLPVWFKEIPSGYEDGISFCACGSKAADPEILKRDHAQPPLLLTCSRCGTSVLTGYELAKAKES